MSTAPTHTRLTPRLIDALYAEAMLLADESRAYFDRGGLAERERLPALPRVLLSCEALKITTRLMHIVAWLLNRRAIEAGEGAAGTIGHPVRRLGQADDGESAGYGALPLNARALIEASRDLYQRVLRLDGEIDSEDAAPSPARNLISRLERAF